MTVYIVVGRHWSQRGAVTALRDAKRLAAKWCGDGKVEISSAQYSSLSEWVRARSISSLGGKSRLVPDDDQIPLRIRRMMITRYGTPRVMGEVAYWSLPGVAP